MTSPGANPLLTFGGPGMEGVGTPIETLVVDREQVVLDLYRESYERLCRVAYLLLGSRDAADDVVQEAFIRLYGARDTLREPTRAGAFLHTTVVNLSRTQLRRRVVALRHAPKTAPEGPGTEEQALARVRDAAIMRALRGLPRRQREVLTLRYYADMSEQMTANSLGVSVGAVKSAASRGIAALATTLQGINS